MVLSDRTVLAFCSSPFVEWRYTLVHSLSTDSVPQERSNDDALQYRREVETLRMQIEQLMRYTFLLSFSAVCGCV